ncbi:MAG: hypothetical protein GXP40_00805 [Chloroflexi bacterium]|nr:hypothetical protein [Chloroflexota bacterium]
MSVFALLFLMLLSASCGKEPVMPSSNNPYEDSPFGFLGQYMDSPITERVYAAYGGYSEIQATYVDLGVHWDRGSGKNGAATWGALERNIDGYRDMFNRYVNVANKNDVNLLITINPGYSKKEYGDYLPTDLKAYSEFVKSLVRSYPTVKHWQIHNEVNGNVFWKDTPQNYAILVRTTSDAIRENCPDCKIVLGSSININASGEPLQMETYFEPFFQALNRMGNNYFDVFDYHFFPPKGSTPETYYRALDDGIASVKNLLGQYNYADSEVWITETMIFTTDGMSSSEILNLPVEYQTISETQQATALFKTHITALSLGVKKIFWNKLTEGPWFDFMFNRCGLVRHPNISGSTDKKLAYYTYKLMVETLDGSDWKSIDKIQDSNGVNVFEFDNNNNPAWIAWNDNTGAAQITITNIVSDSLKVTEVVPNNTSGTYVDDQDYPNIFNTYTLNVSGGTVSITLDSIPVLIEAK